MKNHRGKERKKGGSRRKLVKGSKKLYLPVEHIKKGIPFKAAQPQKTKKTSDPS